ncbi:MAG: Holliday junction resolvase RuvX [Bacteriovoracaceae bacterium]|jgi:putative Holliday junction resolvase|nr:Holliday junction resolvase RuvX [Bacteriovoracaceae bacterium]
MQDSNLNISDITDKHLMCFDYGRKITGISSYKYGSDPFVLGFGRIEYKDDETLIQQILKICDDEFVDIIVIGVPYFTDGTPSKLTLEIQNFIKKLQSKTNLNVFEQDETLSSFEAKKRMQSDPKFNFKIDPKKIDEVAACIILEEFIKDIENKESL